MDNKGWLILAGATAAGVWVINEKSKPRPLTQDEYEMLRPAPYSTEGSDELSPLDLASYEEAIGLSGATYTPDPRREYPGIWQPELPYDNPREWNTPNHPAGPPRNDGGGGKDKNVKGNVVLTLTATNIESVGRSSLLAEHRRELDPDVMVVEQAKRARAWLATFPGMKHRQGFGPEASGIAVMIKYGIPVKRRGQLHMRKRWHGPPAKGGRLHSPRVYPWFELEKKREPFDVLAVHFPTHNNPDAQQESVDAIAQWLKTRRHAAIVLGDFNMQHNELTALANRTNSKLLSVGKVDHALVKNARESIGQRIETAEGAHGWGFYRVK